LLKFELEHSKYEETWGKDLNSIINPHMWERVLVTQDNFISAEITLGDFIVEYKTNLSNLGEIGELISVNSSTVEALRLFVEYCQSNKVTVSELTLRLTEEKRAQLTKEKVKNETIDSISFLLDMTAGEIIEKYGELKGVLRLSVTKKRAVLYTVESMPGVGLFYNTQRKTDDPDNDAYPIEVVVFGDYDKIFEGNVLGTSAKGKWDKIELADRYGEYRLINRVGDYVVSAYCDGPVGINIESDDPETVQKHLDSIHENPTGYVSAITVSKATDEPPKLSEELKLEIQKAYVENHNKNNPDKPITQEDTGLYGYCGEYSGAHVVTILRSGCQYPAIIESIIVNGEEISYSYPPPSVYKNGKFYGVESAFEKGILSAEDIKALAEFTKRR